MNILYFGSYCDKEWFSKVIDKSKSPFQVAQYSFEEALINGFNMLNDINLDLNYIFLENYYPKGQFLYIKKQKKEIEKKLMLTYIPIINLPILKEIYMVFQGFLFTSKWAINNHKNNKKIILTSFNYTPFALGTYLASKIFKIKRVNIFTDLSSDILNRRKKNMSFVKRLILPIYKRVIRFIERSYDGYILFTEPMNEIVNPLDKPYIIIEGIYNNNLDLTDVPKRSAVMYAGTLAFDYGVKSIIDAFKSINSDDLELWLFGDGDMKDYIIEQCEQDNNIKYFGFRPRDEVFYYEKKASVLINVRNPKDLYTKYSFPSKTFEYLVSGTPFISTKLKGIPEEYYSYIFTVNSTDTEEIKNKIEEILAMKRSELIKRGLKARKFILREKTSEVQIEKIIKFINCKIL